MTAEEGHRGRWVCGDAPGPTPVHLPFLFHRPRGTGLRCGSYQSNKIPGMLSPEVPTTAEDNEGDEEDGVGDIIGPDILSDKALHLPNKSENGHGRQGHRQLQGQHQKHLGREQVRAPSQRPPRDASQPTHRPGPTFLMKACRMFLSQLTAGKSWLS